MEFNFYCVIWASRNSTSSGNVTVYGRTANGDVAPTRTISGASTGLYFPVGIAVDTVNNEIFVANNHNASVTVYGRTANGDVTPTRTISGTSTGLSGPYGIAVDTVNNEIFVTNGNYSVTVYGRTANGISTGLSGVQFIGPSPGHHNNASLIFGNFGQN